MGLVYGQATQDDCSLHPTQNSIYFTYTLLTGQTFLPTCPSKLVTFLVFESRLHLIVNQTGSEAALSAGFHSIASLGFPDGTGGKTCLPVQEIRDAGFIP